MEFRKRKSTELVEGLTFPLDDLNQDLLEKVLSWLPTSAFFRLCSVTKRWKSVASSSTFHLACTQIPHREPWFFMVDSQFHDKWTVFDSSEMNCKKLNIPPLFHQNPGLNFTPVAASGGLICFRSAFGDFNVCNPLTGSCQQLVHHDKNTFRNDQSSLHAIAMNSSPESHLSSYKLVLVFGELPNLSFKVYNSSINSWGEKIMLNRKAQRSEEPDNNIDHTFYFLSKTGNVVAPDFRRCPTKQYSSVITIQEGEEIIYFLSSVGTIVACNLTSKSFFEYPRLLPVFYEYSIDLVECGGEMLVILLSDFFESASLRIWKFNGISQCWTQIAAMSPSMSNEFHGKKVDINCAGSGHQIFVCINSAEVCCYFLCDLVSNEWVELPNLNMNGTSNEFVSAFSFEPRIEATVSETRN